MSARARVHAMFNLDADGERELDSRLDAFRVENYNEAIQALHPWGLTMGDSHATGVNFAIGVLMSVRDHRDGGGREVDASFFQPGHTYAREHHGCRIEFHVRHVDVTPNGTRFAFGFRTEPCISGWAPDDSDDMDGWTDVTEGGAS